MEGNIIQEIRQIETSLGWYQPVSPLDAEIGWNANAASADGLPNSFSLEPGYSARTTLGSMRFT